MYFDKKNNFYHGIMFHHFHDDKLHNKSQGSINKDDFYQITEAKIRFYYYQNEIKENLKENISIVLETGGGYGGLAEQIISNHDISRYYIVDISDALPLAYFYQFVVLYQTFP